MKRIKQSVISFLLVFVFAIAPMTELGLAAKASADISPNPAPGSTSSTEKETTTTKTKTTTAKSKKYDFSAVSAKIKEYAKTNKQVVGWLTIPNSNIDTPINIGGTDNYYYLNRDWKGKDYPKNNYKNFVETATFLDYRTDIGSSWKNSSRNIVVYGHNWTNLRNPMSIGNVERHSMFGQLPSYTSIDFLKENPYVYFSAGENKGVWKIFSVAYFETKPTKEFNHNAPNPSDESFTNIVREFKARSMFNIDVDVNMNDTLLTLSTCTRRFDDVHDKQRFTVIARLLRDGELESDPVEITVNPNPKAPNFK